MSATTEKEQSDANVSQLLRTAEAMRAQAANLRLVDPQSAEAARLDTDAEELRRGAVQNAIAADLEYQKARYSRWLDEWRHHRDWYRENDKAVIALSQATQRNLILINAGAAIALLTFVGNLLTKGTDVAEFVPAIVWFAVGVVAGTTTTALSYVTQLLYGYEEPARVQLGKWFHGAAIVTGVLSIAIFVGGCMVTYHAFRSPITVSQQEKNLPPPRVPPVAPPQPAAPFAPPSAPKPAK